MLPRARYGYLTEKGDGIDARRWSRAVDGSGVSTSSMNTANFSGVVSNQRLSAAIRCCVTVSISSGDCDI